MKTRNWLVLATLVPALALGGCAGVPAAIVSGIGTASGLGSLFNTVDGVVRTASTDINAACSVYKQAEGAAAPVVALLPAAAVAKVESIEQYGDAACASPPPGDLAGTVVWLGGLVQQIKNVTG